MTRYALLVLVASSLSGATFQTGQAARAVFGQPSFSSRDGGVQATSLVVVKDRLYAADATQGLLTFDLARLGSANDDAAGRRGNGCHVCFAVPLAQASQSVMPGATTVAVWDKSVAVVDTARHRVMLWRNATASGLNRGPSVVLGSAAQIAAGSPPGPSTLAQPVSVALDGQRLFIGDSALHRVLIWNSYPTTDDQPADAVLGQSDFSAAQASDSPEAGSIKMPAAMASDGTNLFVADTAAHRILVFSPGDAPLAAQAVVNAASLTGGPLAPGSLVTIATNSLTDGRSHSGPEDDARDAPRHLGGIEVVFDGEALPLISVADGNIQAQLPLDAGERSAGSLYLRNEHNGHVSVTTPAPVRLVPANPGLFAVGTAEPRSGILLHHAKQFRAGQGGPPITADDPAEPGEIVTVWATGLGNVWDTAEDEAMVQTPLAAQIDGQATSVLTARLPKNAAGVYEIQIVIPPDAGTQPMAQLVITQNGFASNAVTFPIHSPNGR